MVSKIPIRLVRTSLARSKRALALSSSSSWKTAVRWQWSCNPGRNHVAEREPARPLRATHDRSAATQRRGGQGVEGEPETPVERKKRSGRDSHIRLSSTTGFLRNATTRYF